MTSIITVKFLPWTNTRPSRWKASAEGGRAVTLDANNHSSNDAARALLDKLDWGGIWIRGEIPNGATFVELPRGWKAPPNAFAADYIDMGGK